MVTEIAHLTIDPAEAAAFEAAVAACAPLFQTAEGCHGMALEREVENLARYRLLVEWASVEAHMVTFRESEAFQTWRATAGPFFKGTPVVVHGAIVGRYF